MARVAETSSVEYLGQFKVSASFEDYGKTATLANFRTVTCYIKTTIMIQTYPNPWDFHNTDKTLVSADNYHKIVYYDLNKIAMGAPIGGQCFLETSDKRKIKIQDWCGGPVAWETGGQLVAIPIWTRKLLMEWLFRRDYAKLFNK